MMSATNLSFALFPGLTRGASEAIAAHGDEVLRATYLPHLVGGSWTGAMALTESDAGTDLALLKTHATPNPDSSYAITGTKIFISSGDHDFGGNIVHIVLARLLDAPPGIKGISLFLVPKFLADDSGAFTLRNTMSVGARSHPDKQERVKVDNLVALLTPVIKASFTDLGFESAVQAQQVFGGHGYIREWGREQFVKGCPYRPGL